MLEWFRRKWTRGRLPTVTPSSLLAGTSGEPSPYFHGTSKPYTRWWWLAGPFERENIIYQLDWAKVNGFGGVELAWLWPSWLGQGQAAPGIDWLSSEWSELTTFTKQYASQIGLGCDFTFGSCWPFGGSCVRPEDAAQTFSGLSSQQLHGSWEAESGTPLLVVNHLSRSALEHYAAALLPALANPLARGPAALFCDSLELDTGGMWSPQLWESFAERFGYRLEGFCHSLDAHSDVRYDYRKYRAEAMLREFFEVFTAICHRAGAFARVQCHGAPADLLAAYAAVDIPESEALLFNPTFSRIPASAAALASKPIVSCESFTCIYGFVTSGNPKPLLYWRKENVADLKLLADALFAQGVNQILWHGMPFNGPRGDNEFYASVHVGPDAYFAAELPAFNAYLEAVSGVMRLGRPYSQLAVYLPNEDNWMVDRIPREERTPGAVYRWEMRHVVVPPETEGFAPLWVSEPFLQAATCRDGRLWIRDTSFAALYIECEWLDGEALGEVVRLARAGVPIVWKRQPQQPGHSPRRNYADMLQELKGLPNVRPALDQLGVRPIVEGEDLPGFWVRRTDEHVYLFFAHPSARQVQYPMQYGQSYLDKTLIRRVILHVEPTSRKVELRFEPYQSLVLQVSRRSGEMAFVDITYRPPEPARDPLGSRGSPAARRP